MFTASGREIHFCSHAFPAGGQNACQRVPSQNWEKATATRPVPEPRRLRAPSPQRFGQRSTHQAHDRQACQHDRAAPLAVSRGKPISLSPPMSVSGPPSLEGTSAKRGVPDSSVISRRLLATLNRYRSLGYPTARSRSTASAGPDVAQGGAAKAAEKGTVPICAKHPSGTFRRAPTAGWRGLSLSPLSGRRGTALTRCGRRCEANAISQVPSPTASVATGILHRHGAHTLGKRSGHLPGAARLQVNAAVP